MLKPERHHGLPDLATVGSLRTEEGDLDKLLGDRAAAGDYLAGFGVLHERTNHRGEIEAAMFIEMSVLDAQHGIDDIGRHVLCREGRQLQLAAAKHVAAVRRRQLDYTPGG